MNMVVMDILDSNGNYVVKYKYDAWGNVLDKDIRVDCIVANHNPFLYKGYVYDEETGWYYLQSRYYIPEIGRFLSPDSIDYADPETIGGLNLYAYCNNDPINYCDPSGHSAILIGLLIGLIIGACVGFGAAAYKDYKDDGEVFNGSVKWYDYLGAIQLGATIGAGIGAGLGAFSGMSFSISIPMLGISASGGAAAMTTAGTVAVTVTGAQILTGVGTLALAEFLILMSKHRPGMTNRPPFSWTTQEEGIEAMKRFDGDANKAADYIMNNHFDKWKYGAGNDRNVIKKWLDRIIRKLFGK